MLENVEDLLERYGEERLIHLAVQALSAVHPVEAAVYDLRGKRIWNSLSGAPAFPEEIAGDTVLGRALAECRAGRRSDSLQSQGIAVAAISILEGPVGYLAAMPCESDSACPPQRLLDVLEVCGAYLGEALVGRRTGADLAAELAERYEELSLVYSITAAMDISRKQEEALEQIAEAVAQTLNGDLIIVLVPCMDYAFHYPPAAPTDADVQDRRAQLGGALYAALQANPRTAAINYLDQGELAEVAAPFVHVVTVPLDVDGELGLLALLRREPEDRIYMGHVKMLETISRQLGIFMTNRKITLARKQLFDLTIFGLARLAESRDVETGEHLERVSSYCRVLSQYALEQKLYPELTQEFVENIFTCSPLHDIGKVGIPDAILNKPGRLTPEEFDLMKLHSSIGGDTLRDIERRLNWGESTFLSMGKEIAYTHHEKWDGSGYPAGLIGVDIPLAGRIMAVADVYDALTSKRCYKDAMPHENARSIIVEGRGTHFDPQLVDAFLACEAQFVAIREAFDGAAFPHESHNRFLAYFQNTLRPVEVGQ